MTDPHAEMLAAIRENTAEIRALRTALERQAPSATRLAAADRDKLQAVLPIVHRAIVGRSFIYRELVAHATLNVEPAIALRETLKSMDARKLGQLLRRGVGHEIAGYTVTAVETTRDGVRWAVFCGNESPRVTASFARRVRPASNR